MLLIVIGALTIGLTLGMLGSGGSAITVPVLIYMVGHGAKESIAESMAIVGLISVAAAIPYAKSKQIDWRSVWCFGIPGMLGTLLGAWLGGIASESLQLLVFGVVLLAAAYSMLRRPSAGANEKNQEHAATRRSPVLKIGLEGTLVGRRDGVCRRWRRVLDRSCLGRVSQAADAASDRHQSCDHRHESGRWLCQI